MRFSLPFLLLSLACLSACSLATVYRQPGAPALAPSQAKEIRLYTGRPSGKLVVLGSVAVDVYGDSAKAEEHLREEAAKLGATAVIYVRANLLTSVGSRAALSGTAVKAE